MNDHGTQADTLEGTLVSIVGQEVVEAVEVWFAYNKAGGEHESARTVTDADGRFSFVLPSYPLERAVVGSDSQGVKAIDLEPEGEILAPGELTLLIEYGPRSSIRFAL